MCILFRTKVRKNEDPQSSQGRQLILFNPLITGSLLPVEVDVCAVAISVEILGTGLPLQFHSSEPS